MSLSPGQRISTYEVVGSLGAGGMGEVYRARDTRLERDVAIKVLRADWDDDRTHVARFEREARTLAALNHPNVAQIYGFDELDGGCFLVMELVEGEELADRVARGPLGVDETVEVGRQIAEGLEAAHESGLIHRDLKPQNVRITPEGVAKVLDFGLAKPAVEAPPDETPTRAAGAGRCSTEDGALIGTPTYMSPERVRCRPDDRRGDIWSFGCVLYECLTGKPPFDGGTLADTLAAIVEHDVDLTALPSETPPRLRALIERCLDKDPRTRLRDIGEARVALSAPPGEREPADGQFRPRGSHRARATVGVFALGAAAAGLLAVGLQPAPDRGVLDDDAITITNVTDSPWTEFGAAISPDGKFIAFASDREGPFDAWVRQLGTWQDINLTNGAKDWWGIAVHDLGFTPDADGMRVWVSGSMTAGNASFTLFGKDRRDHFGSSDYETVYSPDGTRVIFHSGEDGDPLTVADADGAHPVNVATLARGEHQHFPVWSQDGEWVYIVRGVPATGEMDLWRVRPEAGGAYERLTTGMIDASFPAPIDDRTVLFLARTPTGAGPWLYSIDVETREVRRELKGVARYTSLGASTDGRRIVATVADPHASLARVPILAAREATWDDVEPVHGLETLSAMRPRLGDGEIYFVSSQGRGDGLWCLRDGEPVELRRGTELAVISSPAVSPDGGTIAAVVRTDGKVGLWLYDRGGQNPRLLSKGMRVYGSPEWAPDGRGVACGGADTEGPGLFLFPASGGKPTRLVDGLAVSPTWSPTGGRIAFLGPTVMAFHEIGAIHLDTGEVTALPEDVRVRVGEPMRFLPDGRRLVFMHGPLPARDFFVLDLDAEEPVAERLTRLEDSATKSSFDIEVDDTGTYIVFDRIEQNSDIVLIELPPHDE